MLSNAAARSRLLRRQWQVLLDRLAPHTAPRWAAFGAALLVYILKTMVLFPSHAIVTYALGIFFLSQLVGFLTPKFDPALDQLMQEESSGMPETLDGGLIGQDDADEQRPFIRKVGEYVAWRKSMAAVCVAFALTFFSAFDLPVMVPVLVVYFIALLAATMRKQFAHMRKFGYNPFDFLHKQRFSKS